MTFDEGLMTIGLALWNDIYRVGKNDDDCGALIEKRAPAMGDNDRLTYLFAGKWAGDAFQRIVITSHTYASALACTRITEACADLHIPWGAWMTVLPNGILTYGADDFSRILCFRFAGTLHHEQGPRATFGIVGVDPVTMTKFAMLASDAASALFDSEDVAIIDENGDKGAERVTRIARRIIVGSLYTMQNTDNFRTVTKAPSTKAVGRNGLPSHRTTFIGRPMNLDCRKAVANYIRHGGRSVPSVQGLVTGHYKRQVVGIGGRGRKVIWLEPYWRGPEDAPILTRPKHIGGP